VQGIQDVPKLALKKFPQISNQKIFLNLKHFLHLKMLNSAPKLHKLMPEIPYVRFSCGNSNIRDLLQILATEIQTNYNKLAATECPQIMKSEKNMSPK
jgi:hypothetical protein